VNTLYKSALGRRSLYNSGRGGDGISWALGVEYREAIERFVTSLAGKSKHTKRIYRQGASHFLGFLEERWQAPALEVLNREHADTWVAFLLEETGYGPNTTPSMVIAARLFCKKLVNDDVLAQDPFNGVQAVPKPAMPDIKILRAEDVQAMVETAKRDKTIWGKRDVALMLLLFYGGFRRDELLSIRRDDVDWRRCTVRIARGKGGEARTVGLDDRAMLALDRFDSARAKYLREMRSYRRDQLEKGSLWLNQRGGHLGEMGLAIALKARAKRAGVTAPVHPHAWRHAAATHGADAGMGDMEMRDKFGWSPTSAMPFRYSRQTLRERTIQRSRSIRADDGIRL